MPLTGGEDKYVVEKQIYDNQIIRFSQLMERFYWSYLIFPTWKPCHVELSNGLLFLSNTKISPVNKTVGKTFNLKYHGKRMVVLPIFDTQVEEKRYSSTDTYLELKTASGDSRISSSVH